MNKLIAQLKSSVITALVKVVPVKDPCKGCSIAAICGTGRMPGGVCPYTVDMSFAAAEKATALVVVE